MNYADVTERLADTGAAKWAIHTKCRAMIQAGADIIELTIGEPDLPPDPALIEVAHQSMLAGRVRYSDGRGEPDLLDALVERYSKRRSDITRDNILCFPGTQTALFTTMLGLTSKGDGVLLGDPYYATYEGVIQASGAHVQPVPLRPENGFRMNADDLQSCVTAASKVLLLNSPHNPSGAVLSQSELGEIAQVCAQHDLWLVCDEVYEELIFDGVFASPFDDPEFSDRTIVLSSISKSCAAPGFRSGWAVGPSEFCARILPLSEAMLFGNQPFIADMTAYALRHPMETAAQMRRDYKRRAEFVCSVLKDVDGLKPYLPQSGMFILVDVASTGLSGEQFADQLLDAGVGVMPGASFGANAQGFIRMSLTVPDVDLRTACQRIAEFAGKL